LLSNENILFVKLNFIGNEEKKIKID